MIIVLRLGHRLGRDQRISTHCGLVARALGADGIVYSGEADSEVIGSINDITKRWGGPFSARYEKGWKKVLAEYKKKKFSVIHLTMYGLPIQGKIKALRKKTNILLVIGGEKVPSEVYHITDTNISIGQQPHSEISSLAIFLHEYFCGKELNREFKNAKIKIIPKEKGKKIINLS